MIKISYFYIGPELWFIGTFFFKLAICWVFISDFKVPIVSFNGKRFKLSEKYPKLEVRNTFFISFVQVETLGCISENFASHNITAFVSLVFSIFSIL